MQNIPQFIQDVKDKKKLLMGFGHRIYKSHDPRANIVRRIAEEVFSIVGREPLVDIARELEKIALSDDYFVSRKLYPNIDFYTGVIYKALDIPTEMFTVMFAVSRSIGWIVHWIEMMTEENIRIS